MVFPRMDKWSNVCGFRPLTVSLTDFKCVFMLMSTPVLSLREGKEEDLEGEEEVSISTTRLRANYNETKILRFSRKFENDRTRT